MALDSMRTADTGKGGVVSFENKENTTASSSVSDAISAAAATSHPTQTRFSFYDAAEVQLQLAKSDGSSKKEEEKNKNRFHFYNAQELEQQNHQQQQEEEQQQREEAESFTFAAKSDDGTEDILRSLQETEEQRMQILQVEVNPSPRPAPSSNKKKTTTRRMTPSAAAPAQTNESDENSEGSNPYEDAIKEALDLLRRHRTPPESPAVVVTGGPGNLQSDSRSITPKEKDRLLQMRLEDDGDDDLQDQDISNVLVDQKLRAKQRQERMARYASRLQEFKSSLPAANETEKKDDSDSVSVLSQSTKQRDEEVQRGVEKVLLAILEKAHSSRERAKPTERIAQETMNDALLRAMDELLQGPAENDVVKAKSVDSNPSKLSERSVVDELLAEDEDKNRSMLLPEQTECQDQWSAKSEEEKKLPDFIERMRQSEDADSVPDALDRYATEHYDEEDEGEDDETEDEDKEQNDDDYDVHISQTDSQSTDRVLGPLSKRAGGTTGVVLDIATDEEPSDDSTTDEGHSTSDEGTSSDYTDDSTTDDSEDDETSSEFTSDSDHVQTPVHRGTITKRSTPQNVHAESDEDREAAELMRTLCAHLLPFGVDPTNSLREAIPSWDNENPNEAGYRIIRLSKPQLRRVEIAFESMIKEFRQQSEERLSDKDAPSSNGYDSSFYKDLQEAERLLDDQERRLGASSDATPLSNDEHADSDKASAVSVDSEFSQCHPDFPGIKSTGKGEMGDLEYFHLPIIFKSHVTGFEPTKDMVLEPGNVVAGQYLVENELGSAAFSTAYRCLDLSSETQGGHEEVCLKVIKNTKDFFDQSLDEIKILELLRQTGQVDENNIVKMKTFFYHREHLVIVTELLRQNLFEFNKFIIDNDEEEYFTVPRLAYITRQALVALRFVHRLGLVHSDIKPENILLSSYSRAKIKVIDFGSSCYLTDRQSSYIQSRSYRAPEVVLGLPYDGRIDVWSLGCVVAEMFTGEVTFQNDSVVSMLSRIEAICGPFPRHMIAQGRQSGRFFTKSGLLYEDIDSSDGNRPSEHSDDDEGRPVMYDIYQPKTTRLSARLGFSEDLMDDFDGKNFSSFDSRRQKKIMFTDFVSKLLTIDPEARPTADEALKHPWMTYAASLTEEEIKYPTS
eukprot:scaffold26851_cov186-Cylindrotheca_fusiformis.AAC.1